MELDTAIRITRTRMFLLGHSYESIDKMNIMDFGDTIAYWKEDGSADEKLSKERASLKRQRN